MPASKTEDSISSLFLDPKQPAMVKSVPHSSDSGSLDTVTLWDNLAIVLNIAIFTGTEEQYCQDHYLGIGMESFLKLHLNE
mgnify:CR=1 FL=1